MLQQFPQRGSPPSPSSSWELWGAWASQPRGKDRVDGTLYGALFHVRLYAMEIPNTLPWIDDVSGTSGLVVARVDLWPSQGFCENVISTLPLRERKCGGMRKPCEATRLVTIRAHALSDLTLPLREAAVTTSCLCNVNGCEPVPSTTPVNVGPPTSVAPPRSCLSMAATPQQKVGLPMARWRPEGSTGYAGRCQDR